jgi:hypothetical protein
MCTVLLPPGVNPTAFLEIHHKKPKYIYIYIYKSHYGITQHIYFRPQVQYVTEVCAVYHSRPNVLLLRNCENWRCVLRPVLPSADDTTQYATFTESFLISVPANHGTISVFKFSYLATWRTSHVQVLYSSQHSPASFNYGVRSEKCVVIRFRHCANVIDCTYTNPDSIVYYTPRLYGIAYYS